MGVTSQIQALKKLTCAISQTLEEQPVLNSKSWLTSLQNDYSLPDSLTERIWLTLISQRISRGEGNLNWQTETGY